MSPNSHTIYYLGVDVAKETLEPDPKLLPRLGSIPNTPAGQQRLLKAAQAITPPEAKLHIVVEATGGYEQRLVEALHAAGIRVSVVLPYRVHRFASAHGLEAKTDRLDALKLTAFGYAVRPLPTLPLTPTERRNRELARRRVQLVDMRTQERNRLENADAWLRDTLERHLTFLTQEIAEVDRALAQLQAADPAFAAKMERLCAIEGVGVVTAAATLAAMPELGTLNRQRVAALAGLAPTARDSGKKEGRRFIRGGRREARRALYMAALAAARSNSVLRPFYQRLRAEKKPAKLALTAVMRRLLIYMNAQLAALVTAT